MSRYCNLNLLYLVLLTSPITTYCCKIFYLKNNTQKEHTFHIIFFFLPCNERIYVSISIKKKIKFNFSFSLNFTYLKIFFLYFKLTQHNTHIQILVNKMKKKNKTIFKIKSVIYVKIS